LHRQFQFFFCNCDICHDHEYSPLQENLLFPFP
jgi:hypothetical protein